MNLWYMGPRETIGFPSARRGWGRSPTKDINKSLIFCMSRAGGGCCHHAAKPLKSYRFSWPSKGPGGQVLPSPHLDSLKRQRFSKFSKGGGCFPHPQHHEKHMNFIDFEDIARGPVLRLRRKILNELHGFPSFRRGWGVVPGAPAHTTHFENYGNHKILVIIGGEGEHPTPPTNIDNYDNPQFLNKG